MTVQIIVLFRAGYSKLDKILFMFLIFRSAGNFNAIPERVSLKKDRTELNLKAKQGLLTSIAVKNVTLLINQFIAPRLDFSSSRCFSSLPSSSSVTVYVHNAS